MKHRHPGKYIAHTPKGRIVAKHKPIHDLTIKVPKRIMDKDKGKSWNQLKRKYPHLNPLADVDHDGKRNYEDCKPFDKKKQDEGDDFEERKSKDKLLTMDELKEIGWFDKVINPIIYDKPTGKSTRIHTEKTSGIADMIDIPPKKDKVGNIGRFWGINKAGSDKIPARIPYQKEKHYDKAPESKEPEPEKKGFTTPKVKKEKLDTSELKILYDELSKQKVKPKSITALDDGEIFIEY